MVYGFANYLLTRNNCDTELSTDEVIMNAHILAETESIDPSMHIEIVHPIMNASLLTTAIRDQVDDPSFYTVQQQGFAVVVRVHSFPLRVALRVVTSHPERNADYQWVMDVMDKTHDDTNDMDHPSTSIGAQSSFVGGSCPQQNRIAGRGSKDIVMVTIPKASSSSTQITTTTTILAGWSTTFGAVSLTPTITFISDLQHSTTSTTTLATGDVRRPLLPKSQHNVDTNSDPTTNHMIVQNRIHVGSPTEEENDDAPNTGSRHHHHHHQLDNVRIHSREKDLSKLRPHYSHRHHPRPDQKQEPEQEDVAHHRHHHLNQPSSASATTIISTRPLITSWYHYFGGMLLLMVTPMLTIVILLRCSRSRRHPPHTNHHPPHPKNDRLIRTKGRLYL
jgi:hypothetical protein